MRKPRVWIAGLLLAVGFLEALLVLGVAQERRTPWPPPPVQHDADDNSFLPTDKPPVAAKAPTKQTKETPPQDPKTAQRTALGSRLFGKRVGTALEKTEPNGVRPVGLETSKGGDTKAVTTADAKLPPPPVFPTEQWAQRPDADRKTKLPNAPTSMAPVAPAPEPAPVPAPVSSPPAPLGMAGNASLPALPEVAPPAPTPAKSPAPLPELPTAVMPPAPAPAAAVPPSAAPVSIPPPITPPSSMVAPSNEPTTPARPIERGPREIVLTPVRGQGEALTIPPSPETRPSSLNLPGPDRTSPYQVERSPVERPVVEPARETNPADETPAPALGAGPLPPAQTAASAWLFQTPRLLVEKRGPAALRAGETGVYRIIVRNPGEERALNLLIEDALPPGVNIVGAEPQATVRAGRVRWLIPVLGPVQEASCTVALQASAPVQLGNTTGVRLNALGTDPRPQTAAPYGSTPVVQGPAETRVPTSVPVARGPSPLLVSVQTPTAPVLGQSAVFKIAFTNQGKEPLRNVKLYGYLPAGLQHPAGPTLETSFAELLPGASHAVTLPVTVLRAGPHTLVVKVLAAGGVEASAQGSIDVGAQPTTGDGIRVTPATTSKLQAGQEGELRIDVANQTGRALRQVSVLHSLPEGLDFVAASDRGLYQSNNRTAYWLVDLEPGQVQHLSVRVQPQKAGALAVEFGAQASGLLEAKGSGTITVDGKPELELQVAASDPRVEVGRKTMYEIRVSNPGSAGATAVQVQVAFPEGLQPRSAHGPAQVTIDRGVVTFLPLPFLSVQGSHTWRVWAEGKWAGDQVVRVAVACDQVRTPLARELNTTVYVR